MAKVSESKWNRLSGYAIGLLLAFMLGTKTHGLHLGFGSLTSNSNNKNLPANLDTASVEEVYDALKENFDGKITEGDLVNGLKKGLVDATGDPYTNYLSPNEAELFRTQLAGKFSGIGAELGRVDGRPVVIAPISGYPADKVGLKPKDIIVKINGQDSANLTLDEAVLKIRGEVGTKVTLNIVRGQDNLTFEITREEINIPSVTHEIIENGAIGYLKLSQFGDDTDGLVDAAVKDFTSKGVKAVIVDLRNNGGGLLQSSTHIAGLWLPDQVVVREKRDGKVIEELRGDAAGQLKNLPTIVLVNEGSASASEILAGALQDTGKATLVGQKTFGKGSVQTSQTLGDGGSLKVTIAHWFTPKDRTPDKVGFKPDVEVDAGTDPAKDPQKTKAIELLKSKI